jgi:hypothetical protein
MNEIWEPMMYRTKSGPPMKLVYWPHDGYWQLVTNDENGLARMSGQYASAEQAAAASQYAS